MHQHYSTLSTRGGRVHVTNERMVPTTNGTVDTSKAKRSAVESMMGGPEPLLALYNAVQKETLCYPMPRATYIELVQHDGVSDACRASVCDWLMNVRILNAHMHYP